MNGARVVLGAARGLEPLAPERRHGGGARVDGGGEPCPEAPPRERVRRPLAGRLGLAATGDQRGARTLDGRDEPRLLGLGPRARREHGREGPLGPLLLGGAHAQEAREHARPRICRRRHGH